jgi:hypothetical protein
LTPSSAARAVLDVDGHVYRPWDSVSLPTDHLAPSESATLLRLAPERGRRYGFSVGGRRQKRLVHATLCLLALAALSGPISSAAATPLSDQAVSQLQYWNSHPGSVCKAMTGKVVVSIYGEGSSAPAHARHRCVRRLADEGQEDMKVLAANTKLHGRVRVTIVRSNLVIAVAMLLRRGHWKVIALKFP